MSNIILKIDGAIAKTEYVLLSLLIASLTLILSAQVILRYFFSSPLFWAEEVSVQILIASSFIGISYLLYSNQLLKVDFILSNLKQRPQQIILKLLQVVNLIIIVAFCYYGTDWILQPETRVDVSPTTQLPRWYNYAILIASFYCMAIHQLVKIITPHSAAVSSEAK